MHVEHIYLYLQPYINQPVRPGVASEHLYIGRQRCVCAEPSTPTPTPTVSGDIFAGEYPGEHPTEYPCEHPTEYPCEYSHRAAQHDDEEVEAAEDVRELQQLEVPKPSTP